MIDLESAQWGTVPEWVTACASLGALVAAIIAGRWAAHQTDATRGQLALMTRTEEERAEQQRREQAVQISTWLTQTEDGRFAALVYNASKQPVFQVSIRFVSPNNDNLIKIGPLEPHSSPIEVVAVSEFINEARIATRSIDLSWNLPGFTGPVKRQVTRPDGTQEWKESQWHAGPLGLGVIFTDTQGIRWERTLDGILEERPNDHAVGGGIVMPLGAKLGDEDDYFA